MSYQYGEQKPTSYPQYGHQYSDSVDAGFNPYEVSQPYRSYEQGGQGDYNGGYTDDPSGSGAAKEMNTKERDRSVFENDDYQVPKAMGPKTSKAMRRWRYEHQGNLWTKGGRGRCCGRFFVCTIMIFFFLLISVVLSLVLWVRPPNLTIGNVSLPDTDDAVQINDNPLGATVNLGVNISVNNPNYFSVQFRSIDATITYPLKNIQVGNGTVKNIDIKSNQETNFTFPFTFDYNSSEDPSFSVLQDLADRCGFGDGGKSSPITVDYKIVLDFKVFLIPIKYPINNSFSFDCPFTSTDLEDLLKQTGLDKIIPLLTTLLSKKAEERRQLHAKVEL